MCIAIHKYHNYYKILMSFSLKLGLMLQYCSSFLDDIINKNHKCSEVFIECHRYHSCI